MVTAARHLLHTILVVTRALASLAFLTMRSRAQLAAENLFLRRQLALYQERQVKARRADDATRIILAGLSRLLAWRQLLVIVKSETLIRWHRQGFRLFWRWKSPTPGRPAISPAVQRLIGTMATANRTWGEERIANELLLKLGIRVSPRTVRRYMPSRPRRPRPGTQAWCTFVRNHAGSVLASDFFVVVTATFRVLYVFVVLEVGTRRILQWNVTAHPTAEWTAQQCRMIVPGDQAHRFVIHDRDTIYSEGVDRTLEAMGLRVLKTPVRAPQANAFCERVIGTIRRECLDFMIPMSEGHVRAILREWVRHYNRGRPHASLGPGIPEGSIMVTDGRESDGRSVPAGCRVAATPILSGLHHEYRLERHVA
jgi:transposase InsO family protein